jgi:hypothetical protein
MPFCFNFRQILTHLPGTDAELLSQLRDRHGSTGQSPHHASEAIGLGIGPWLAPSRVALVIHRLRAPVSALLRH